ncbi:MAG: DUF1641 domain-containing protein [Firmicutes bacterium]|nr:DUF1641 domain-containing protein [Bacillota bacterium]
MANPIQHAPPGTQAGDSVHAVASADENLAAILESLQDAGALRFIRAFLEQRQPLAEKLMEKMDTEPTKRGLKNAVTLMMGLGALPDGIGVALMSALTQGFERAGEASQLPDADKMSVWQLMGMLKNPDVARAVHYLMGFLEGLGKALKTTS